MSAIRIESKEYELNQIEREYLMLLRVQFKLNQKRKPRVVMSAIWIEWNEYESKENTSCCYKCDSNWIKREHLMLVWVRFKFEQKSMNQIESKENTLCCYECNSYWIKRVWIESKEYWPWQLCQLQLMSKRPERHKSERHSNWTAICYYKRSLFEHVRRVSADSSWEWEKNSSVVVLNCTQQIQLMDRNKMII